MTTQRADSRTDIAQGHSFLGSNSGVPDRPGYRVESQTAGVVSFDAMAPLGSPLHITGLWSASTDTPGITPITASRAECLPPLLRKPFAWRDLYRRTFLLADPTGGDHGYHRPASVEDWMGIQSDLAKAGAQTSRRGRCLMALLPLGLIGVILPAAHLLPPSSLLRECVIWTVGIVSVMAMYAGLLPTIFTGNLPEESSGLDGQYQPAGTKEFVGILESRKKFPQVEALWKALSAHAIKSEIPILKGDMGALQSIAKKLTEIAAAPVPPARSGASADIILVH